MKPSGIFHCAYLLDYCKEAHTLHRWLEAFSLSPSRHLSPSLLIPFRRPLQCWHHQPLLRTPKGHSTAFWWSPQAGNLMFEFESAIWEHRGKYTPLLHSIHKGKTSQDTHSVQILRVGDEKLPYPNSNIWTDLNNHLKTFEQSPTCRLMSNVRVGWNKSALLMFDYTVWFNMAYCAQLSLTARETVTLSVKARLCRVPLWRECSLMTVC